MSALSGKKPSENSVWILESITWQSLIKSITWQSLPSYAFSHTIRFFLEIERGYEDVVNSSAKGREKISRGQQDAGMISAAGHPTDLKMMV
jgi:hypothetical protein